MCNHDGCENKFQRNAEEPALVERWPGPTYHFGRLLEEYTDICTGLPSDAAFSQRTAGVEGKVEFGRKVRSAWKKQAGTVITHISDDTTDRRAASQDDLGTLKYFSSRKPPTLKHGQHPNLQFRQPNSRPNLFHKRKSDCFQSLNL
jgi:hypothetical protein